MTAFDMRQFELTADARERLRAATILTLADPARDAQDLRTAVRDASAQARANGYHRDEVLAVLRALVEQAATPDVPYIAYQGVLERVVLWCLTVYHRPSDGGAATERHA